MRKDSLRFLADENVPGDSVALLSDYGYDILWVAKETPGLHDQAVWNWAARENRILLTFDLDFGRLLSWEETRPQGIILFRFVPKRGVEPGEKVLDLIHRGIPFSGHLIVIRKTGTRVRKLD